MRTGTPIASNTRVLPVYVAPCSGFSFVDRPPARVVLARLDADQRVQPAAFALPSQVARNVRLRGRAEAERTGNKAQVPRRVPRLQRLTLIIRAPPSRPSLSADGAANVLSLIPSASSSRAFLRAVELRRFDYHDSSPRVLALQLGFDSSGVAHRG